MDDFTDDELQDLADAQAADWAATAGPAHAVKVEPWNDGWLVSPELPVEGMERWVFETREDADGFAAEVEKHLDRIAYELGRISSIARAFGTV